MARQNVRIFIARNVYSPVMETHGFTIDGKWLLIWGLVLILASCYTPKDPNTVNSIQITPLKVTTEVEDLSPYVEELVVLQVGVDGAARTGISKIIFADPVVFLCGGVVFSASSDWQEITRIGNVGRGPGEYLSIKDIAINAAQDELWCLEVLNSVLRYDLKTGIFLGKMEYEDSDYVRAMIPQQDNSIILYTPNPLGDYPQRNEIFFCLKKYNSSGREIDKQLPWSQFNVMASFSIPVSTSDSGEYVLTPESSNVAQVFSNEGFVRQIVFDFENKWIPANFFDPRKGDPAPIVGDLFEMDCYKLLSSVFFLDECMYFHVFGKESSFWNFVLSKDRSRGIRWKSIGVMTPPIKAIAADREYLYFLYDDYGYVENEHDPLKKVVLEKWGAPQTLGSTYLIKVKFNVK